MTRRSIPLIKWASLEGLPQPDLLHTNGWANEPGMKLNKIIERLQEQERELKILIAALRDLEGSGPIKPEADTGLEHVEKRLLMGALERAEGNQSEAARLLGIGRDRMRYKLAKYDLDRRRRPK
jgi:DNA-binding protein Fis